MKYLDSMLQTDTTRAQVQLKIIGSIVTVRLANKTSVEELLENRIRAFAGSKISGGDGQPQEIMRGIKNYLVNGVK